MTYRDQTEHKYNEKRQNILKRLPDYCTLYLNAKADKLENSTEANYAADLLIFFTWVTQSVEKYIGMDTKDVPVTCFEELTTHDIDAYLSYLSEYIDPEGNIRKNKNQAKARKLSALRTLCKYLNRIGLTKNDPTEYTETPKMVQKDIVVLTPAEQEKILNAIETGTGLNGAKLKGVQLALNQRFRLRNKAIFALLLGTGMRISELVGLDVEDVDLDERVAYITRKGNRDDHVYLSKSVAEALNNYLLNREVIFKPAKDEKALFISKKANRLTARSVQYMIKFYSDFAVGSSSKRRITPHKFRSTFGTQAYLQSHDLELTAALLGHKNVQTTSKAYVRFDESLKRDYIDNMESTIK